MIEDRVDNFSFSNLTDTLYQMFTIDIQVYKYLIVTLDFDF
ncbi:hypothetical protein [Psychrobacillus sp. NPDC093200]